MQFNFSNNFHVAADGVGSIGFLDRFDIAANFPCSFRILRIDSAKSAESLILVTHRSNYRTEAGKIAGMNTGMNTGASIFDSVYDNFICVW